jgi:hypothetical protein
MKTIIASLLGLLLTAPAWAQADREAAAADQIDREPVKCISPNRIDRTEVIDERTVVFYMRGGNIYRNQLSRNCPQLVRERRFSYKLSTNRLCDVDVITVLEYWGTQLRPGVSCGLGMFYPITAEEAELLDIDPNELQENASAVEETVESSGEAVDPNAVAEPAPQNVDTTQYSTVDSWYREDE